MTDKDDFKAVMGFDDPDLLPMPDVVGEGELACSCGLLKVGIPDEARATNFPGASMQVQCEHCGDWLAPL